MVRQFLLIAGLAAGLCASAQQPRQTIKSGQNASDVNKSVVTRSNFGIAKAQLNDGSNQRGAQKAANTSVSWKRPAGQFWGTGYSIEQQNIGFYYTPLVLRPWVDYTFVNQSTVSKGTPSWNVEYFDFNQASETYGSYTETTVKDQEDLTWSWQQYEMGHSPVLTVGKGSVPYPSQYYKESKTDMEYLPLCIGKDIASIWSAGGQPVSSHYWSLFTRQSSDYQGLTSYYGAQGYEDGVVGDDGTTEGWWFGTNAMGYNAMATRFEKPEQPYLLNAVYWYYQFEGEITHEIPVKAYVFKTLDPAKEYTGVSSTTGKEFSFETCELGELIAESEAVIPMVAESEDYFSDLLTFEFKKKNPVTGAETAYSLEIEDDITIVVVGYDVNPGPETAIRSCMSTDEYDEGYGNLGFLGWFDLAEDGSVSYRLTALKDFFSSPLPNTTLGVLADVSYPWIQDYYVNQDRDIALPNEGETTETEQGLQYVVPLLSTSETTEFDVTYNGEDECDWLSITDVYDEMEENEDGEEEFSGICALEFTAAPNPDDVKRTCVVKISIPAATYEVTFRQGTGNVPEAVEVVAAEGAEQYFDLAGRRVMNPEKGLYIKVNGQKAEKVIR